MYEMFGFDIVQQPVDREVVAGSDFLQQLDDRGVVSNILQQPVERVVVAGSDLMQQPVDRDVVSNMLQQPMERVVVAGSDLMQQPVDRDVVAMPSAWIPPSLGLCKINVDGAFSRTKKLAGIGVVIRDHRGQILAALCTKIRAQLGVLEVEAKAYEAGMLLARHLGLMNGALEGDSLIISNALKRVTEPPTSFAAVVEGIHALGSILGVVHYSHVRRNGNQLAHILARQALSLVNDVIWIEETLCCIQQALIQDVCGY